MNFFLWSNTVTFVTLIQTVCVADGIISLKIIFYWQKILPKSLVAAITNQVAVQVAQVVAALIAQVAVLLAQVVAALIVQPVVLPVQVAAVLHVQRVDQRVQRDPVLS